MVHHCCVCSRYWMPAYASMTPVMISSHHLKRLSPRSEVRPGHRCRQTFEISNIEGWNNSSTADLAVDQALLVGSTA